MKKLVLVLSFLVLAMPVALAHEPRPGKQREGEIRCLTII